MADSLQNAPFERSIDVERLRSNAIFKFDESPTEAEADAIRENLGLRGLRKMRFQGEITPLRKRGWHVTGTLGASITQECVVSLDPVKTRIDTDVSLRFLPDKDIDYDTPEDVLEDDVEPLEAVIDLGHVAVEALALAMPEYPRSEAAGAAQAVATPQGAEPIKDEETKPFAGLSALRDSLSKE